ncbi:MAG: PQQ-binding-like beta-propeller repeat protein [Methanofollis sp.]|uniref:outer membrane protein assembly factor BamB family protein n=1 Tax=Methanofollis sp. TaxID=2052835 RepID=UPI0026194D7A|nr:PQQ-binding-like beta-propeller repeat protein [Methanofollis sp.]MDD4255231.1 PQQ-binding-like beta-propeller repeat protein [Methanofollis sp.]
MRCAIIVLCLLLAVLPAGALAGDPIWTYSAPSEIACLTLTPDGSHVLVGGERLCFLAGNGTPLWEQWSAEMTASSADGRTLAGAGGLDLALYAGDASVLWKQDLASDCVALALSSDGKRLVVADLVGEVHFYDADGTLRATVDTRGDPEDEEDEFQSRVRAIALSGKGTYAAVVSSRGLFYYTGTGRRLWTHEGMLEGGTAVAVSGTGDEVAVASDAGVRLLNRTGALLWTHPSRRPVTALAVSEDGSRVLSGAQDNTLACFDREGEILWTFTAEGWIRDVAVSKNGSRVLAGSMDKGAYLFDGDGNLLGTYTLAGCVGHVALTADGTAGVASSSRQVIGISTVTPKAAATVPTVAETPVQTPGVPGTTETVTQTTAIPTAAAPTTDNPVATPPGPEGSSMLPLLLACLLFGGVALGAGYLHRRWRPAPPPLAEEAPAEAAPPVTEEETPAALPWEASLDEGKAQEAARLLSRQMVALIEERTGARVLLTADALDACPDQRGGLAWFFATADRLAYAPAPPEREEVEILAAAYLSLAEEIG